MSRRRSKTIAAWIAGVTAIAAPAFADPPPALVHLIARGDCPTAEAVAAALAPALRGTRISSGPSEPGAIDLQIDDLGARYRLTLWNQSEEFADPARQCDRRAGQLAVRAAFLLDPLGIPEMNPAPRSTPPAPTRRPKWLGGPAGSVALGFWMMWAPENDDAPPAGFLGGEVRGTAGWTRLSGTLGVALSTPGILDASQLLTARFIRGDVGLSTSLRFGALELAFEAGPALLLVLEPKPVKLRAKDVIVVGDEILAAMAAGRVAVRVVTHRSDSPLNGFVALEGTLATPQPIVANAEADREVGRTPFVWIGMTLGVGVPIF